jgi:hypothetical protein
MPWLPELFTAPVLQRFLDRRHRAALVAVPYFDGLMAGDPAPLVESFAGEPDLHDPLRGAIKGVAAFRAFVAETSTWLQQHHAWVEDVEHVILDRRGMEEVVLHFDTESGTVDLPVAVVAERQPDGAISQLRVYFSSVPLTGRHLDRAPLLRPDPGLPLPDAVEAYLRAFAVGDPDGVVAAFEPDGWVREAVDRDVHRGRSGLRAYYEWLFASGGGIPLEACALVDDGHAGALEYNVVRWGRTREVLSAGAAVFVRGRSGKLAAVRLYDDTDPSLVSSG